MLGYIQRIFWFLVSQPKGFFFTGQGCLLIGVKVKQGAETTNFFEVVSFIDCHVSTSWNFVTKIFRIRTWYIGAIGHIVDNRDILFGNE